MKNQREESNPVSSRLSVRRRAREDVPLLDPPTFMLFSYVSHAWIVTPEQKEGAGDSTGRAVTRSRIRASPSALWQAWRGYSVFRYSSSARFVSVGNVVP